MSVLKKVLLFLLSVLLVIIAVGYGHGPLLAKIEVWGVAGQYNTLVSCFPEIVSVANRWRLLFVGIALLIVVLLFYRPLLLLILHTSFSPELAPVDPGFLGKYWARKLHLDLSLEMESLHGIEQAIAEQDKFMKKLKEIRGCRMISPHICYYGIAHAPLVFRLGFLFGDQSNIFLLHKTRSNQSQFVEWSDKSEQVTVKSHREERPGGEELIISIATSSVITREELGSLKPKNKHILMFETNNLAFDCITSYKTAEAVRTQILVPLRDFVKTNRIKRMHLVISSSVAFTFFLAQAFSAQQDPITIVYHYQNGLYPWGICINDPPSRALVISELQENVL